MLKICRKCFWCHNCSIKKKSPDCKQFETKQGLIKRGLYPKELTHDQTK